MTTFTLTGHTFAGHPISLTWKDGTLSGDPDAVAATQELAEAYEGLPVGPGMTSTTTTKHLKTASSAYLLMQHAFADRPTHAGDAPGLGYDTVRADGDGEDDADAPKEQSE